MVRIRIIALLVMGLTPLIHADLAMTKCEKFVDIALVIDVSSATSEKHWVYIHRFFEYIALSFNIMSQKARFSIVTFSNDARVVLRFGECQTERCVSAKIKAIRQQTTTGRNLAQALNVTDARLFKLPHGDRSAVPDTVLIYTAGNIDNDAAAIEQARSLKARNVKIIVCALGTRKSLDLADFRKVSSAPNSEHLMTINPKRFNKIFNKVDGIVNGICAMGYMHPDVSKCTCSRFLKNVGTPF